MPDERAAVSKEATTNGANAAAAKPPPTGPTAAAAKPAAETAPVSKDGVQAAARPDEVAPSDNSPAKAAAESTASAQTESSSPAKRRLSFGAVVPVLVLLLAAVILFGIAGGWSSLVGGRGTQKTDDAYLRADITPLSTRVSGTVAQVAVADYPRVKAGDLLVQLKDDDFKAQVAQAQAGVAAAQAALANNAKQKELQDARILQTQ